MRSLLSKICLAIAVFLGGALASLADCSSEPDSCTPKQLCEAATTTKSGVKIWSTASEYLQHVAAAKDFGINCGVVEIVASCANDPDLCSVKELCKQAVTTSGNQTSWKISEGSEGYISLAKEYDLSCGVTEVVANPLKTCAQDAAVCNVSELCTLATFRSRSNLLNWTSLYPKKYAIEAKRRGSDLWCGNKGEI